MPHSTGDFLRRPCANCPFRTDVRPYLTRARVEEIEQSVIGRQQDFPCHKTVHYDTEDGDGAWTKDTLRCGGMTILLEKLERPTQMMRIEERLGLYDARKMDMDAPVFDSFDDMADAQER